MSFEKTNNPAKEKRDISNESQVASEMLTSLDTAKMTSRYFASIPSQHEAGKDLDDSKDKYGLYNLKDLLQQKKTREWREGKDNTQKTGCSDDPATSAAESCCSRRADF